VVKTPVIAILLAGYGNIPFISANKNLLHAILTAMMPARAGIEYFL
jgi:hypothetical protein